MSRGRIRLRQDVRAPAKTVFQCLTDLEHVPRWDRRVEKVTQMTRGPLRSGVILRTSLVVDGESTHFDDEITDFEPPTRFGLRSVLGSTNVVTYTLVEDDANVTHVDVDLAYDLPDPPPEAHLDDATLRDQITAEVEGALRRLRDVIEGSAAP